MQLVRNVPSDSELTWLHAKILHSCIPHIHVLSGMYTNLRLLSSIDLCLHSLR